MNHWLSQRLVALIVVTTTLHLAPRSVGQDTRPSIRYYNSNWNFNDVDVGQLARRLDRIGIELPVDLQGKVTVAFSVGIPLNALTTAEAWRFNGTLTSSDLVVSSLLFRNVQLSVRYIDGVLTLERLSLDVPPGADGDRLGSLRGKARIELVPQGSFTSTLTLTDLPLSAFGPAVTALRGVEGRLAGEITAGASVERLTDITAWTMAGPISLQEFVVRGLPGSDASAEMSLADGVFIVRDFRFRLGDMQLTSGAAINLTGRQLWTVNARLAAPDLRDLLRNLGQALNEPLLAKAADFIERGEVSSEATLTGALDRPRDIRASGAAEVNSLAIALPRSIQDVTPLRPLESKRLAFRFSLTQERIELSQIDAAFAGGAIGGDVTAPLSDAPLVIDLHWDGLQPLLIFDEPIGGRGPIAGRLTATIPRDAISHPARWQFGLNATVAEITYGGWTLTDLQANDITLRGGRLIVPSVAGKLENEPIAVSLDVRLTAPFAIDAAFNLPSVRLSWLRHLPQAAALHKHVSGVASLNGRVSGAWKPFQLEGNARVGAENLQVAERVVDSVHLNIALDRQRLALTDIVAELFGGRLTGGAAVKFGEQLSASADVGWTAVDLGAALGGDDLYPVTITGVSSGNLALNIPAGDLADPTKWTADGRIQVESIDVYAWQFRNIEPFEVHLVEGTLKLPAFNAIADGAPFQASVGVGITAPWRLDVDSEWKQARLDRLASIPALAETAARLAGRIDFTTQLRGELSPLRLSANGHGRAAPITIDKLLIDRAEFKYDYRPEALRVTQLKAKLGPGRLNGDVTVPLKNTQAGETKLSWADIDVGAVTASGLAQLPLQGTTTGNVALEIPAGSLMDIPAWGIDAHVQLPDLRSGEAELASLEINLLQRQRTLSYDAAGRLLGGALHLSGNRTADAPVRGLALLGSARVSLRDASLANAASMGQPPGTSAPIAGLLSVSANSTLVDGTWRWNGELRLSAIQVRGVGAAEFVEVVLSGSQNHLQIENIGGRIAGGTLTGGTGERIAFKDIPVMQLGLRGARVEDLIELATGTDRAATGTIDIVLRVNPGAIWRINGAVTSGRARAGGQTIRNARLPINAAWHPRSGRGEIHIGGAQLAVAGGRITGRLTARRAQRWSVDGRFRFFRVDFASFAGSDYGGGRLSGTLRIGGRDVRSANDLTAVFQATLEDAQAAKLPLLGQLRNYVPGMSSSATRFGEGRVEATLNRGVIRLKELSLASSQLQIYIEGRATLAGRLNLNGIVSTGSRLNPFQAQSLLTKFALNTVAPITLLATANDFLSNRVVRLAITGTIRRPTVRLLPFASLREEVVRYFLRQAASTVLPGGGAAAASARDAR